MTTTDKIQKVYKLMLKLNNLEKDFELDLNAMIRDSESFDDFILCLKNLMKFHEDI